MIRHIVLFRWQKGTTAEDVAAIATALRGLPAVIPEIRRYELGSDAGLNDGNHEFAVVADFDDRAGYFVYRNHPDHRAIIAELVAPRIAERASVQYEID